MIHPRRDFIKKVSLAALGAGCIGNPAFSGTTAKDAGFILETGLGYQKSTVSSSRVIKESVGLRPFRRSGPRIETPGAGKQAFDSQLRPRGEAAGHFPGVRQCLHVNCWPKDPDLSKIAVMGCGVLGLSTARTLPEKRI